MTLSVQILDYKEGKRDQRLENVQLGNRQEYGQQNEMKDQHRTHFTKLKTKLYAKEV